MVNRDIKPSLPSIFEHALRGYIYYDRSSVLWKMPQQHTWHNLLIPCPRSCDLKVLSTMFRVSSDIGTGFLLEQYSMSTCLLLRLPQLPAPLPLFTLPTLSAVPEVRSITGVGVWILIILIQRTVAYRSSMTSGVDSSSLYLNLDFRIESRWRIPAAPVQFPTSVNITLF